MAETSKGDGVDKAPRSLATRARRALKDADRVLKRDASISPEQRSQIQAEQAKAFALLELASSIRARRRA